MVSRKNLCSYLLAELDSAVRYAPYFDLQVSFLNFLAFFSSLFSYFVPYCDVSGVARISFSMKVSHWILYSKGLFPAF